LSDLSRWYYHLQQDFEETQATCMINLALTTRDWSIDRYKQMQVSCAENHFSRTIDIHQRIEDESSKDTSHREMIYTQ